MHNTTPLTDNLNINTIPLNFSTFASNLPKQVALPPLGHDYDQVANIIHPEILKYHYEVLHRGYVDRYNAAAANFTDQSIENFLSGSGITDPGRNKQFLFGGYINHALYWRSFSHDAANYQMSQNLAALFNQAFKSRESFKEEATKAMNQIHGSGWLWVMYSPQADRVYLNISSEHWFPVQDVPLLAVDVWEHAYLWYSEKGCKVQYISKILDALNWNYASERLDLALAAKEQDKKQSDLPASDPGIPANVLLKGCHTS
ncbi:superoxide dismutase, Fe-Mn family [Nematocida homosporus]|uniref:superoxide dismutase, Fe-Mn family n=1 Tax=Nematocida homosporus TaxID=1912981 RepID=UPI002220C25F|nr:superoxide dismutase, Fe-Mn family [Nematocida homosporus]KAI5186476.1 superoxide dismutase, Fe-Mn family [Nematocida homosporus]